MSEWFDFRVGWVFFGVKEFHGVLEVGYINWDEVGYSALSTLLVALEVRAVMHRGSEYDGAILEDAGL